MNWILLRGLIRESRHWGAFAGQLELRLGERVLALDLPGNGELFLKASPLSVSSMVDGLRRQLHQRGMAPPYRLLGMSLGGMVAADWAQRYTGEVTRLVLVNTSMRPFSGMTQRLRPSNWAELLMLAGRWREDEDAERIIFGMTCRRTDSSADDLLAWKQIRKSAPVSRANAVRQLVAAATFSCIVAPPACPVLVLSSAADALVHPQCSADLVAAWKAAHQQHPWAGHDLPHDDGDWVCRAIAKSTD